MKKVVGEAHVKRVIIDSPDDLWKKTSAAAGIDKKFYDSYFNGRKKAVAFELENVIKYDKVQNLSDYGLKTAPQSFAYVNTQ